MIVPVEKSCHFSGVFKFPLFIFLFNSRECVCQRFSLHRWSLLAGVSVCENVGVKERDRQAERDSMRVCMIEVQGSVFSAIGESSVA